MGTTIFVRHFQCLPISAYWRWKHSIYMGEIKAEHSSCGTHKLSSPRWGVHAPLNPKVQFAPADSSAAYNHRSFRSFPQRNSHVGEVWVRGQVLPRGVGLATCTRGCKNVACMLSSQYRAGLFTGRCVLLKYDSCIIFDNFIHYHTPPPPPPPLLLSFIISLISSKQQISSLVSCQGWWLFLTRISTSIQDGKLETPLRGKQDSDIPCTSRLSRYSLASWGLYENLLVSGGNVLNSLRSSALLERWRPIAPTSMRKPRKIWSVLIFSK